MLMLIIHKNKIEFLSDSNISYFEYCQEKNISKKIFNTIYLCFFIAFYKDNFIYDEFIIEKTLKYVK